MLREIVKQRRWGWVKRRWQWQKPGTDQQLGISDRQREFKIQNTCQRVGWGREREGGGEGEGEKAQAVVVKARNAKGDSPFMLTMVGYLWNWSSFRGCTKRKEVLHLGKYAHLLSFFENVYSQITEKNIMKVLTVVYSKFK